MILRKNRAHQSGSSNLSTQSEHIRPATQPGQSRLAFLSTAKSKQQDDPFETKPVRNIATPFDRTRTFYEQHGKKETLKTQLSLPRSFQLEEPEKMKMPFTGESQLIFDKNFEKYSKDYSPFIPRREALALDKELLAKEKHEVHAKAIQETQLVGYDKYSADTLKNNVNLEKVREAKRVLRRKYANRVNMYRIYSAWDADHKGTISIGNFYSMAKKLGLNLNYDEARVLLASADKTGKGTLDLDEFFDLVNNKDDALNVDLDNLSKNIDENYLLQKEKLEQEDDNVIKKLEENAKKARDTKHMNQVNLILKNKLNELALSFGLVDTFQKGYTTYDQFEQNIKKLRIDEKLISDADIRNLYNRYSSTDHHTINYRDFLSGLKDFNFYHEEAYKEYENPQSIRSLKEISKNYSSVPTTTKRKDEINIVDVKYEPYSTVYNFLGKKRRISRLIQKFFPRKEDFKVYLAQALKISVEETDSHLLSKDDAKKTVLNLFKKFDISNLTNRDFEGFLSSFIYNKHNYTQTSEILKGVYEEDEDELINKISKRPKGPPPQKGDAFNQESLNDETPTNNAIQDKEEFYSNKNESDKTINEILKKIDDRIFIGRKKAYDVFKMFDVDKDGYISRKDFTKKAVEMSLISKEEIPILLDYLDDSNKGYVNFKEFHQKIRSNATQQDDKGQITVFPFVLPSKESFEKVVKFVPETKKKLDEIKSPYEPDNYSVLRPTSRFGQAPAWKNTFTHIQPNITSPMFITERDRFLRTPNAQVLPTTEEKEKKFRIQSAKVERIKQHQEIIKERADKDMQKYDILDQNRLKVRAQAAITHEQNARMRNNIF